MATQTSNMGLTKPSGNEAADIGIINANMDIIDNKVKEVDDKASNITVPVTKVNNKIGDVVLTASDVGAEPTVPATSTADFFSGAKAFRNLATDVRAVALTGLSTVSNVVISATDTVLSAFGKLQAQITANLATLIGHTGNSSNPHSTTKSQVGLSNVSNTDTTVAGNINIVDAGGKITATNVEGALQEIVANDVSHWTESSNQQFLNVRGVRYNG